MVVAILQNKRIVGARFYFLMIFCPGAVTVSEDFSMAVSKIIRKDTLPGSFRTLVTD
jgi:hypothetical protein